MSSCKLCASLVGTSKLQYNDTLAKEHAQSHLQQLHIFDETITFDQILDQCFPREENSKIRSYTKSSKYKSLVRLCRKLFPPKPPNQSRGFLCKKCNSEKIIYDVETGLSPSKIIDHACCHLKIDLFGCRKCDRQFRTSQGLKTHLSKYHRLSISAAHFESRLDEFVGEISIAIKECFSEKYSTGSRLKSGPKFAGKPLSDLGEKRQALCYELFKKFCHPNGSIQCHLCSKGIQVQHKDGYYSAGNLLQHAFQHLQKPVVRCKVCSDGFSNRSIMRWHLQSVHALPIANNYECRKDQFHGDIMAMLRKCYSDDVIEGDSNGSSIKSVQCEASAACKTARGSNLKIERRLFCYTLCRKFTDGNEQIKCRMCGKRIKSTNTNGSIATGGPMRHAITHLNKPALNRCKLCPKTYFTRGNMHLHLRAAHSLPPADNFECLADQFHHEILTVLRKCYDGEKRAEKEGEKVRYSCDSTAQYTKNNRGHLLQRPSNSTTGKRLKGSKLATE